MDAQTLLRKPDDTRWENFEELIAAIQVADIDEAEFRAHLLQRDALLDGEFRLAGEAHEVLLALQVLGADWTHLAEAVGRLGAGVDRAAGNPTRRP